MKYFKKDTVVSVLFVSFITLVFLGTVLSNAKGIAWNVIKNNDSYVTDDSVNAKISSYITAYENSFNDSIIVKQECVDTFGLLQRIMGKRVIPTDGFTGTIVKGSDNKLYTANSLTLSNVENDYSNNDIDEYADSLIEFKTRLSEFGADLLYVQAPQKYYSEVEVPISLDTEYYDSRTRKLLTLIKGKVDYLDFNDVIDKNENLNRDDVFFKTDHHWKVESAFICYQSICEYINSNFSYNIDGNLFNSNNWNYKILKNSYLGSTGVRVGKYYAGQDDFAIITPKFDTDFVRNYTSTYTSTHSGDFKHSLINDYDALISGNYKSLAWGSYSGADTSFVNINNNLTKSDKKILVIKDSFALPVCTFLSTTCKQLDICDLRSYNQPVIDKIKSEKYDLVLIIYNPPALKSVFFNFYNQ